MHNDIRLLIKYQLDRKDKNMYLYIKISMKRSDIIGMKKLTKAYVTLEMLKSKSLMQ